MTPTTDLAQRIAVLFGRRLNTAWSEKEVRRYKQLVKDKVLTSVEDLDLIERYYAFQRRKGPLGIHRRDLCTFLNNFPGELDRARAWDEEMRERSKRKVRRHLDTEEPKPASDTDWKRISDLARKELERFKDQYA